MEGEEAPLLLEVAVALRHVLVEHPGGEEEVVKDSRLFLPQTFWILEFLVENFRI